MNIEYIITPIMSTIIGYGTNYIAVKMLFRPKKEIKVFGHTLPFTPGAIPKGKPRLAKAVGDVVGSQLVTEEDIKAQLLNEKTQSVIVEKISEIMSTEIKTEVMTLAKYDEDSYLALKEKIADVISEQILNSIDDMDVGSIIAEESGRVIKEKTQGSMLKMFVTDELVASLTKMIGDKVQKYIDQNGAAVIGGEVNKKIDDIEQKSVLELLEQADISKEKVDNTISSIYVKAVDKALDGLFKKLNLSKMIEDKINAMDMDELEELVMKVMKKELNTIVNLGAVIGFLLGIINTLLLLI